MPAALLVTVLVGCACAQDVTPSVVQVALQERARLFTAQDVERIRQEALLALAEGAGLRLPQEVPVILLTADEALARREAYSRTLDEHSGVTSGMDWIADLVFSRAMLGRYLPDEKVLYVIEDVLEDVARRESAGAASAGGRRAVEDLLFGVIAHELTHAYDDQVYRAMPMPGDLLALVKTPERLPELQALMSLIEGRATWAAELASVQARRKPLEAPTLEEARGARVLQGRASDGAAEAFGKGLVNAIARMKFVQYAQGRLFAKAAYEFGGEPFFEHVFASHPLSLAEVADFEVFKVRWAEELEARADAKAAAEAASGASKPPLEQ
ncbi:MAG: hypothetical protein ACT4PU_12110 [Planctomycetota bacterium]